MMNAQCIMHVYTLHAHNIMLQDTRHACIYMQYMHVYMKDTYIYMQ